MSDFKEIWTEEWDGLVAELIEAGADPQAAEDLAGERADVVNDRVCDRYAAEADAAWRRFKDRRDFWQ